METQHDISRRGEMAGLAARARTAWQTRPARGAFKGLRGDRLLEETPQHWAPLQPIQFYDAGPDEREPEIGVTAFASVFRATTSTVVGYCVDMPNPYFGTSESPFRLDSRWTYLPKMESVFAPPTALTVPADWQRRRLHGTQGFAGRGYWRRGPYAVDVFIDGRHVVGGSFVLY